MSKAGKYNTSHIRHNYTYTVYEIADLFKLTPDTIFRWIREQGLKRLEGTKKYYVHSTELKKFIQRLNRKNKHSTDDNTIFCCKCRCPKEPTKPSLTFKVLPNKTIRVSGACATCSTKLNKVISASKWHKKHPLHPTPTAPTKTPKREHQSPRKCQTKLWEQLCLNLTP